PLGPDLSGESRHRIDRDLRSILVPSDRQARRERRHRVARDRSRGQRSVRGHASRAPRAHRAPGRQAVHLRHGFPRRAGVAGLHEGKVTPCMADPRRRPAAVALRTGAALVAVVVGLAAASAARAQELSGFVELTYSRFDSSSEFPGGLRLETLTHSFLQRYALTYTQRFTPTLRMEAGGVFEWDATRFEFAGLETRSQI